MKLLLKFICRLSLQNVKVTIVLLCLISIAQAQNIQTQILGNWKMDSSQSFYYNKQIPEPLKIDWAYWCFQDSGKMWSMSSIVKIAHRTSYTWNGDTLEIEGLKHVIEHIEANKMILTYIISSGTYKKIYFKKVPEFDPDCISLVAEDGRMITSDNRVYSGICRTYYANGQLQREEIIVDGYVTFKGLWYKNGQKKWKANYEETVPTGPDSSWYENGNLKKVTNSNKYGKLEGSWKEWYDNGQLQTEYFMKQKMDANYTKIGWHTGVKDGEYKEWYENGQMKTWGFYDMGKEKGEWKNYDIKGNLISSRIY